MNPIIQLWKDNQEVLRQYMTLRELDAISFERVDDEGQAVIGFYGVTAPDVKAGMADYVSEILHFPCVAASELEKAYSESKWIVSKSKH